MRPCRIQIGISDGFVSILMDTGSTYDIALNRIKTPLQLLGWCDQLMEKTWVEKGLIQEFINLVCEHKGWEIHGI